MQSIGTWASICVGVVVGVSAGRGIVGFVPGIAVAGVGGATVVSAMVNGKVECDRAVAASRVGGGKCWSVGAGIVCDTIPEKAVARGNGFGGSVAVVDVQV